LSEIDAGVTRARSAAEKGDRDVARARRLYADSVATLEQVQNTETARDVAGAELETALFNRRYAVIVAPAAGVILRRSAEPGELVQPGTPIRTLGSRTRGAVGRVEIRPRAAQPVALVPVEAVLEADGSHATVFTLSADGRRAERRTVTIGFLSGDRVAVVAGLDGVRTVITDGAPYLDDRSAV